MLISLMYHHINGTRYSNDFHIFQNHLQYLLERYNIVTPGDSLGSNNNLCLTFDDAYYDFYHYVFPLLQKYNIKAVLAVPTGLIEDNTNAAIEERLSLGHDEIYIDKKYRKYGTFCTWNELKEMHKSGLVVMASHSHKHKDLSLSDINLEEEIIESKKILEEKLSCRINTFILPFGRYNKNSFSLLKEHYTYIFKVGQGINKDFSGVNGLIYRIDADNTKDITMLFTPKRKIAYFIKSLIKSFYDGIQKS